jgi:hypothetical protein
MGISDKDPIRLGDRYIRFDLVDSRGDPDGFRPTSGVIINMGSCCSTIAIKVNQLFIF